MQNSPILRQAEIVQVRINLSRTSTEVIAPQSQVLPPPVTAFDLNGTSALPVGSENLGHEAQFALEVERRLAETRRRLEREFLARDADARARYEQADKLRVAEHAQCIAALDLVLQGANQAHEARLRDIEQETVGLAFAALCKVLGPQPDLEQLLVDLVEHGMRGLREQPVMSVRMNPEDLEVLSASDAWHDLRRGHPGIQWRPDPSLLRASCNFDSERGTLEAGMQTQLSELAKRWSEAVAGRDRAVTTAVTAASARKV